MEAVGVDRAVIYSDEAFIKLAAARHPHKFAGVPSFRDPAEIGEPSAFFTRLRTSPEIIGVRLLAGIGENWRVLAQGDWDATMAAAEEFGVPVVFWIPLHLTLLQKVAKDHPRLHVIVDHLGMPAPPTAPLTDKVLETLPDLLELAAFPNVAVKFTGAPSLCADPYPFSSLWPHLHRIIDAFGVDRLMWGTDYTRVMGRYRHPPDPGGRLNYRELVDFLLYTDEVSEKDKEILFSRAIRKWFDWPNHTDPAAQ
jgi:predicted TIM-barrel fold metal-dependent hydrolase